MDDPDYAHKQLERKRRGLRGPALPGASPFSYWDRYLLKPGREPVYSQSLRLDREYEQQLWSLMPALLQDE
jgi:hypothetical protein